MSEIRIDLTIKKATFSFYNCFKIAIIQLIPMRQPSPQRHNFFIVLMLPEHLLTLILVGNEVCNSKTT